MKFKGTKLSKRTLALLAAAVVLLGSGGVMGVKAAPNITANSPYDATLNLNEVRIDLVEKVAGGKENPVSDGTLTLTNDKAFSIGKKYDDVVSVKNTGSADEYVRVIVRKYWTDEKGKRLDLDPELIELTIASDPSSDSKWTAKPAAHNKEYTIYYLSKPLSYKAGENTKDLFAGFRINEKVKTEGKTITLKSNGKEYASDAEAKEDAANPDTITYTYNYDGISFNVELEAQAVQTHNAVDAIKSVWGVDASSVGITTLVD